MSHEVAGHLLEWEEVEIGSHWYHCVRCGTDFATMDGAAEYGCYSQMPPLIYAYEEDEVDPIVQSEK